MEPANSLHVIVRFHDSRRIRELDRALFSLAHQNYRPITVHIVTQRFSEDELKAVAACTARYSSLPEPAAFVISDLDSPDPVDGRSALINIGLRASAKGRFFAFLDYDDVIYPEAYQALIANLLSGDAAIAFGGIACKGSLVSDAAIVVDTRERRFKGDCLLDLFKDNFCPIHSFVVDRSRTTEAELFFNERLHRAEDYDFLLRLCAKHKSDFSLIDTVIADYYFKDDGSNTTELTATTEDRSAPWRYAVEYANLQKRFLTLSPAVEASLGLKKSGNPRTIADLLTDREQEPKPPGRGKGDALREFVPPGHFYSPIPSRDDVTLALEFAVSDASVNPLGASLQSQVRLFEQLAPFFRDFNPPDKPGPTALYYHPNDQFSLEDASLLQAQMRLHKPKRIVEVGSGYSSAVMLDTVRNHGLATGLTFVEPYPERLKRLVSQSTLQNCTVIESTLQAAPLELFTSLESGDVLFIDSSHVLKAGSDLQFLCFSILPRLNPGVIVHFHDIFWDWEYPANWLREGRGWNESYAVRAILQFSERFEVLIHLGYLIAQSAIEIGTKDPLSTGSLWLRYLR
ncbi:MAG: class I SAM-dependent methyltransferase [Verrucomicrobia bacterium]|nr:class I SAM-dependent methyltransferase [Verrucomicrobiota bacterium]